MAVIECVRQLLLPQCHRWVGRWTTADKPCRSERRRHDGRTDGRTINSSGFILSLFAISFILPFNRNWHSNFMPAFPAPRSYYVPTALPSFSQMYVVWPWPCYFVASNVRKLHDISDDNGACHSRTHSHGKGRVLGTGNRLFGVSISRFLILHSPLPDILRSAPPPFSIRH